MGVPAFFRWLSRKYPSIVVHCVEEKPKEVNGTVAPVDSSKPNPNDVEFDNLYLDMNGIIHPCCHPEDKPAPKNEDEMMVLIFEYIDRIFSIVRPRRLLYMAIDGVAPRAKMNQQRSRRFRASKEAVEKAEEMEKVREEVLSKGGELPPEKPAGEKFDSNCITPGTPFMFRLADCLRYYVHDRLNNDPGWKGIKVILSDANVPGEGEHKIMDYIRRQRAQPDHDPNTHHCLCGADADLIMLGLATHEPHFTIIREEFKPNKPRPCDLCGQFGHELKDCCGVPKEKSGEFDEVPPVIGSETEFIFLRLNILREYLEKELAMPGLPFKYDFERALDDWVFMCFFVGNDFLPHLPSLEIREGAIDRLVKLYKHAVYKTGGYLTNSGVVALERVQLIMQELGEVEDEIFKKRRETELDFRRRNKMKKMRMERERNAQRPSFMLGGQYAPTTPSYGSSAISNPRQTAADFRMVNNQAALKALMESGGSMDHPATKQALANAGDPEGRGLKRKIDDEDEEPQDDVKLWEDGWKDRYYTSKFQVGPEDIDFRHTVANHYVRGLCWVLRYYYQGCASWKWYFPYHYAPFASDFVNIGDLPNDFERNTEPFKPLEQLMGVFPAASRQHLPPTWQRLMTDADSPIIDFYPIDFKIDLNGKKFAWQGVALLPFVDEKRLKKALKMVYDDLTPAEVRRNVRGHDRIFVASNHSAHSFLEGLYEGSQSTERVKMNPKLAEGLFGDVWCDTTVVRTGGVVKSPLPGLPDLFDNKVIVAQFQDPQFEVGKLFEAVILPNATFPGRVLKPGDFDRMNRNQGPGSYRPQLGFQRDSGYRQNKDLSAATRMIMHNAGPGVMSSASMLPSGAYGGNMGGIYGAYSTQQQGGGYGGRNPGSGGYGNQGQYGGRSGYGGSGGGSYGGGGSSYGGRSGYNSGGGGYGSGGGGYGSRSGGYSSGGSYGSGGSYNSGGGSYSSGGGNYNSSGGGYNSGGGYGGGGYGSGGGYGGSRSQGGNSRPGLFPTPPSYHTQQSGGSYNQQRGGSYNQQRGGSYNQQRRY